MLNQLPVAPTIKGTSSLPSPGGFSNSPPGRREKLEKKKSENEKHDSYASEMVRCTCLRRSILGVICRTGNRNIFRADDPAHLRQTVTRGDREKEGEK